MGGRRIRSCQGSALPRNCQLWPLSDNITHESLHQIATFNARRKVYILSRNKVCLSLFLWESSPRLFFGNCNDYLTRIGDVALWLAPLQLLTNVPLRIHQPGFFSSVRIPSDDARQSETIRKRKNFPKEADDDTPAIRSSKAQKKTIVEHKTCLTQSCILLNVLLQENIAGCP